jgi:hypothetical protein
MNRPFKLQPIFLAAYLATGVAAFGASYSYKNYVVGERIALPTIQALAPIPAAVSLQAIAPHVAPDERSRVLDVVRLRLDESEMLHREWVKHMELKQELLKNELSLWLLALASSLGVLASLHIRKAPNAL